MSWSDRDEGPSDEDVRRFNRTDPDDFDDGLFPEERWEGAGPHKRLRWHNARIAVIAGILLILFFVGLARVF